MIRLFLRLCVAACVGSAVIPSFIAFANFHFYKFSRNGILIRSLFGELFIHLKTIPISVGTLVFESTELSFPKYVHRLDSQAVHGLLQRIVFFLCIGTMSINSNNLSRFSFSVTSLTKSPYLSMESRVLTLF